MLKFNALIISMVRFGSALREFRVQQNRSRRPPLPAVTPVPGVPALVLSTIILKKSTPAQFALKMANRQGFSGWLLFLRLSYWRLRRDLLRFPDGADHAAGAQVDFQAEDAAVGGGGAPDMDFVDAAVFHQAAFGHPQQEVFGGLAGKFVRVGAQAREMGCIRFAGHQDMDAKGCFPVLQIQEADEMQQRKQVHRPPVQREFLALGSLVAEDRDGFDDFFALREHIFETAGLTVVFERIDKVERRDAFL